MNSHKLAIIGGSGIYSLPGLELVEEKQIETPFGMPSDNISTLRIGENEFYFIPRHGKNHQFNPSEINYRANIFALKSLGVEFVLSVSAVGSLKEELPPKTLVLPDQFLDWTKGSRKRTFFEGGAVGHVSNANPVNKPLQEIAVKALEKTDVTFSRGGCYICIEGPQFSTSFESKLYKSWGIDVIGMTNVPEAFLAKEAGIGYATIAMVTDYDGWKQEHCTLEEIMEVMKFNNQSISKFIPHFLNQYNQTELVLAKENQNAVVTNPQNITMDKSVIETLLK